MAWHNSFSQFLSNTLEHTKASFWNSVFQEALDNDNYLKESKLDTTKVVNTSDAVATDVKALNAVHANPNVEGTMAKQIANNTQQINVLLSKVNSNLLTLEQINNRKILCGFYSISPETASTILGITTLYAHNVIVFPYTSGNGFPSMIISSTSKNGGTYIRHLDGDTNAWAVREIATTTKTDVTLLNGWSNLDGGTTTIMTAYKNGNLVFISGILQTGTKTDDTTIGVLPVGFRPSKVIKQGLDQYSIANQFTRCMFSIDPNGNIYMGGVTQSYVAFNITIPIG